MNTPTPTPFANAADTWNQRFESEDYIFGTEPNAWLREHAGVWQPGQNVLCVADGEGRNSVWLAGQGLRVDAFDVASVGVAKAHRYPVHGIDISKWQGDIDWSEVRRAGTAASCRIRSARCALAPFIGASPHTWASCEPRHLNCAWGSPAISGCPKSS